MRFDHNEMLKGWAEDRLAGYHKALEADPTAYRLRAALEGVETVVEWMKGYSAGLPFDVRTSVEEKVIERLERSIGSLHALMNERVGLDSYGEPIKPEIETGA